MYLFDTSVFSAQLTTGHPSLLLYADLLRTTPHLISFQTQAELWQGALLKGWGEREQQRLRNLLAPTLTVPADSLVGEVWGALRAHAQKIGRSLGAEDAWVGACAIANDLIVVSNDKDLVGLGFPGLQVICRAGGTG